MYDKETGICLKSGLIDLSVLHFMKRSVSLLNVIFLMQSIAPIHRLYPAGGGGAGVVEYKCIDQDVDP